MTLTLYSQSDDKRVVNKTLTAIASGVTITPTKGFNVLKPTIIINYDSTYLAANYFYISDLDRYYYIADMEIEIGKCITLTGEIDVRKSFQSDYPNIVATVIRSESVGAPTQIPDSKLPIDPNKEDLLSIKITNRNDGKAPFPANPSDLCYILTVMGGLESGNQS